MTDAAIDDWLLVLDHLDYYALFALEPTASADDVKRAFHAFAETFHPDGHAGRSEEERRGLDAIFKRGTEAYAVLMDPVLRARYDAGLLRGKNKSDPPRLQSVPPSARASQRPPKLEDCVRSPTARPFARRAEELVDKGDLKQAKLQMVMANHHDPDNDALKSYLREIEERLRPGK